MILFRLNIKTALLTVASALLIISPGLFSACTGSASTQGTAVGLSFPDGYSYDAANHSLSVPSGKNNAVLPPYVTSMTLTISGEDQDVETYPIDLTTLTAVFTVSPGIRTFTITVTTDIGLSFTDSVTIEVVSGHPINLNFNLNVNAPPQISAISATPAVTAPGGVVALSCSAADLDPADQLTYAWTGPAGRTASGPQTSFTVPDYGQFEFTCIVDDGWGGVTRATVVISAPPPNEPPVVTLIQVLDSTYMTVPTKYYSWTSVVVKCSAFDPEGDPITYAIADQNFKVIGTGPTSSVYSLPNIGGCFTPGYFTFYCSVNDKWHNPWPYSKTIAIWGGC